MHDIVNYGFYGAALVGAIDIAGVAARLETYKGLKYAETDQRKEISDNLYSSICFYLVKPYEPIVKLTKYLPFTHLLERKMKKMLEGKTTIYGIPILDIINRPQLKLEDIGDMSISRRYWKWCGERDFFHGLIP